MENLKKSTEMINEISKVTNIDKNQSNDDYNAAMDIDVNKSKSTLNSKSAALSNNEIIKLEFKIVIKRKNGQKVILNEEIKKLIYSNLRNLNKKENIAFKIENGYEEMVIYADKSSGIKILENLRACDELKGIENLISSPEDKQSTSKQINVRFLITNFNCEYYKAVNEVSEWKDIYSSVNLKLRELFGSESFLIKTIRREHIIRTEMLQLYQKPTK